MGVDRRCLSPSPSPPPPLPQCVRLTPTRCTHSSISSSPSRLSSTSRRHGSTTSAKQRPAGQSRTSSSTAPAASSPSGSLCLTPACRVTNSPLPICVYIMRLTASRRLVWSDGQSGKVLPLADLDCVRHCVHRAALHPVSACTYCCCCCCCAGSWVRYYSAGEAAGTETWCGAGAC